MFEHRIYALLAVAAVAGGATGIASAASIGINFNNGSRGGTDTLASTQVAGVAPQQYWNNLTPTFVTGSTTYSAQSGALVDSGGSSTTALASITTRSSFYDISSTTGVEPDASNGNQILMNGGGYGTADQSGFSGVPGATVVAQVTGVPYARYNVYVYGLVDHAGVQEGLSIGTGNVNVAGNTATFAPTTTYYETTPNPSATGYIDGTTASGFTYTKATSLVATAPTAGADYAEFTGVTGSSFEVGAIFNTATAGTSAGVAIEGLQIVAVPEPATMAPAGLGIAGIAGLVLLRRKRKLA